jgi:hypothetical protein
MSADGDYPYLDDLVQLFHSIFAWTSSLYDAAIPNALISVVISRHIGC